MSNKSKITTHKIYNKKSFLSPNSIYSMSAIHTKIYEDGIAGIRLSDCQHSIKIWNDMNDVTQVVEMLEKIDHIRVALEEFKNEIRANYEYMQ